MKVYAARTFIMVTRPGGRPRLWVVLTEPAGVPPQIAIVSFSSDDGRKDRTVRLGPRDHPYIWKPTIAFYTDTQIYDVAALEAAVSTGLATLPRRLHRGPPGNAAARRTGLA